MPSFRFVAFYSIPWVGREEVVSDSIWVDVADGCVGGVSGLSSSPSSLSWSLTETVELFVQLYETYESFSKFQLKVGPPDGIHRDYIPGKSFNMKVQGDPGAKVGLVAVDNAVYLLNKDRLTQSKVCVEVKKQSEQRQIPLCVVCQQFRRKRCPNI